RSALVRRGMRTVAAGRPASREAERVGRATRAERGGGADPGDLTRLEALYREQYESSVHLAHLQVGDRHRPEELTQDAFVRLLPRLSTTDNPGGYLRVVLVNLCRDHGRRQALAGRHPQQPGPDAPPPGLPPTSSAVWQALQALPERQRVALSLRF